MSGDVDSVVDAQVVQPLAPTDAEQLDKRIRMLVSSINDNLAKVYELVEQAKTGEIHKALSFPSWTAYVADVFKVQLRLDRGQRRELVGYLSGEGMSQRAIADVVGADRNTVRTDLRFQVDEIHPPGSDCVQRGKHPVANETPTTPITGRDGKTYPPRPPRPQAVSKPRRRSITDEFFHEILKWHPRVERISKLGFDDRVGRNRQSLTRYRNDLIRFRDTLNTVIDKLGGETA